MSKPWLFVSPASRGIGLQLARRLLRTTDLPVIATARKDVKATSEQILEGLDVDKQRLEVLKLDVTYETTISEAASHCKSRFSSSYLRLAFCIPGILHPEKSPSQIDHAKALSTFQINTLGPLLLSKHFSPLLPRRSTTLESIPNLPVSAILALMSARVGSISDNSLGGWYSYRASKAAVNSIAKSVDIYLKQRCGENAMCVGLHPGTVKTGLSEEFWVSTPKVNLFTPEFAAEKLIQVVKNVGLDGRGKCWDWEGKEIPP
ncbi:MAG: hypothetical protein ASARMPREDX12_002168 [Alectoria sarmentosa]|nr:MAG: hypothetical protein ASARMPRED_000995 [Alectoria sarmentosa]CAD6585993.1 MAG: hypothetical protein ASARMPREDX12_002168 [Alectoria sarmentosa]